MPSEVHELTAWFTLERELAHGPVPASVRSIAERFGWPPKRAHDFLTLLEDEGRIEYERGRPRHQGEIRLAGQAPKNAVTVYRKQEPVTVEQATMFTPDPPSEPVYTEGELAVAVAKTWAATQVVQPTNGTFRRAIGQAKQLVRLADTPRDLAEAIHGIELLWPYSEGRPWGIPDLVRKFHEAREAYYRSRLPTAHHDALADWLAHYGKEAS